MRRIFSGYKILWLIAYLLINCIAALIIFNNGMLLGDMNGVLVDENSLVFFSLLIVLFCYVVFLGPVFSSFSRMKIPQMLAASNELNQQYFGRRFNLAMVILQLMFMYFNISNGTNIAGNVTETNSIWKYFWIFFPVDMFFIISYGYFRGCSFFKASALIFILSNLQRGWAGGIMIVIFFELYRSYLDGRFNVRRIAFVGVTILLSYPILQFAKWSVRSGGAGDGSLAMFFDLLNGLTWSSYVDSLFLGVEHIIGRIQLVSTLYQTITNSQLLQELYESGTVLPFWLEGMHGVIYEKLLYGERTYSLATAVLGTEMFSHSDRVVGTSVTNLSYASWFFVTPILSIFYILYTLFILFLSVCMIKLNGSTKESLNLLWFVWFIYLFPPWFGSIISFVYCMGLLLIIRNIFPFLSRSLK